MFLSNKVLWLRDALVSLCLSLCRQKACLLSSTLGEARYVHDSRARPGFLCLARRQAPLEHLWQMQAVHWEGPNSQILLGLEWIFFLPSDTLHIMA